MSTLKQCDRCAVIEVGGTPKVQTMAFTTAGGTYDDVTWLGDLCPPCISDVVAILQPNPGVKLEQWVAQS